MRIAYFGPAGTNTEEAVRSQPDLDAAERVPYPTIAAVVRAAESGECTVGMVPVETQLEGSVGATLDLLAGGADVLIRREVVLTIDLALVGHAGTDLPAVTEVLSFPMASAQCRTRLDELVPTATIVPANSTAEAVQLVAKGGPHQVAIGTSHAAALYGLDVIDPVVADQPGAETRFLLVGKGVPQRTGADKTSIVIFLGHDRPGSLLAMLQEFAVRGLNLTKIESRPTKGGLGEYWFFIDIEGHLADALVEDALRGLKYRFETVQFLGSYPRARSVGLFHEEEEEREWASAGTWVEDLTAKIEPDPPPS